MLHIYKITVKLWKILLSLYPHKFHPNKQTTVKGILSVICGSAYFGRWKISFTSRRDKLCYLNCVRKENILLAFGKFNYPDLGSTLTIVEFYLQKFALSRHPVRSMGKSLEWVLASQSLLQDPSSGGPFGSQRGSLWGHHLSLSL